LAAALEDGLGVRADLIEGDHGVFDVAVNGDLVFSKQEQKSFIATQAVVELVRRHLETGRE
jgi:predicted nicotinamide N-methyase